MKYAISACLCGINCKYNGGNNYNKEIRKLYDNGEAILICPEELSGLSIPRSPSEITKGRVINKDGIDCTKYFIDGANKALKLIKENGVTKAILKENSPSCGVNYVYDGSFSNKLIKGKGITTKLLEDNGIIVVSDKDYNEEK